MSPARRLLFRVLGLLIAVIIGVAVTVRLLSGGDEPGRVSVPDVAQDQLGTVVLVPGYGGSTSALEVLAGRLQQAGRTTSVLQLTGDGTGDLQESAARLDDAVQQALRAGAPSVDVIGYSAGGVVARLWARDGGAASARRIVTLGAPHHGTEVAAAGSSLAPGVCPEACRQLVPGSSLLDNLNAGDETPDGPQWLSLWTAVDQTVTPPDSARLDGATDVVLQDVCPGAETSHSELPRDPRVQAIVLAALGTAPLSIPTSCPA